MGRGSRGKPGLVQIADVAAPASSRALPARAPGKTGSVPDRGIGCPGAVAKCPEGRRARPERVEGIDDRRYRPVEGEDIVTAHPAEYRLVAARKRIDKGSVDPAENTIGSRPEAGFLDGRRKIDGARVVHRLDQFEAAPGGNRAGEAPFVAIGPGCRHRYRPEIGLLSRESSGDNRGIEPAG